MGFLSVLGKIGKVAAPIAAGIFGGPLAAAAAGAGVNALDKKMHGGSWKDTAISGATGAGTGLLTGGMVRGLGPSGNVGSAVGNVAKKSLGNAGSIFGSSAGKAAMMGGGGIALGAMMNRGGGNGKQVTGAPPAYNPTNQANYAGYMRGLGPTMGTRNQNFPNLAQSIGAGRQEALGIRERRPQMIGY